jgi:hypothetical protein
MNIGGYALLSREHVVKSGDIHMVVSCTIKGAIMPQFLDYSDIRNSNLQLIAILDVEVYL